MNIINDADMLVINKIGKYKYTFLKVEEGEENEKENTEEISIYGKEYMEKTKEYRYGMRLRGFSIGCQPKEGFIRREDDESGYYHDIIVYNRELTEQEISDYELDSLKESWFRIGLENVKEPKESEEYTEDEQMEVNDLLDEIAG